MHENIKLQAIINLLITVTIVFVGIIFAGKYLTPFIIGVILTYILNPLVDKIHTILKIKRNIISFCICLLIFLIFLSVPLLLIPLLLTQLKLLLVSLPTLINNINVNILNPINFKYGTSLIINLNDIKQFMTDNINHSATIVSPLASNGILIIKVMVYTILIPFIMFYTFNYWKSLLKFFDDLIPKGYIQQAHLILHDIDIMLSAYLRGQISVMIIMSIYYATALHVIGLNFGILIGIFTGVMVFIPYIGIAIGLIISLALGFANYQDMHHILIILFAFGIGHILEGGIVTPFLIGGKIGLNPIMVILSLMLFSKLLGLIGILLALPLATITIVLLRHAKLYYTKSPYYNNN